LNTNVVVTLIIRTGHLEDSLHHKQLLCTVHLVIQCTLLQVMAGSSAIPVISRFIYRLIGRIFFSKHPPKAPCVLTLECQRLLNPFYILLTVHLGVILVNNQLDALFSIYLFLFSTYFEQLSAHHQENQLYQYIIWYIYITLVDDCLVCRSGVPDSHIQVIYIPDDVLLQLIHLMMSTGLLETCREVK
jgi:hypothetical protein